MPNVSLHGWISIHGDTRPTEGKSTCRFIRLAYRASNEKQPEDSSNISVHLVSRVISLFYRGFTIALAGANFECVVPIGNPPSVFAFSTRFQTSNQTTVARRNRVPVLLSRDRCQQHFLRDVYVRWRACNRSSNGDNVINCVKCL